MKIHAIRDGDRVYLTGEKTSWPRPDYQLHSIEIDIGWDEVVEYGDINFRFDELQKLLIAAHEKAQMELELEIKTDSAKDYRRRWLELRDGLNGSETTDEH